MNELTKRRLVGGVIVLSLAMGLIIWANQSDTYGLSWRNPVPPKFQKIEIDRNIAPPELDEIQEKLDKLKDNLQELAKSPPKKPKTIKDKRGQPANPLDEIIVEGSSVPPRWVVQAASFQKQELATMMKQQLADNGFVAVVRASRSSKDVIIYAVYVGPFLQVSKAEENAKLLKDKLKIEGIIRKWE